MLIGAHIRSDDPLGGARAKGADVIQMFLSNPQSWKKPVPREDADELKAAGIPIYAHAPYLVNVGSANNRVRIPSRKIIADTVAAAAAVGAAGVVVHGGHLGDDEDLSEAWDRWRKALEPIDLVVPVLIENTAGGGNAALRDIANYGPLWEAIGHLNVGVCLDTCHAWAAGDDLETVVERICGLTGGISLVHCNDSRDPFDSSRDRHANLGRGFIPEDLIVGVVRAAGAPVVVETPDDDDGQAKDIVWLRERLGDG
ncbi:MAG: deoxyribonuclease IV [Acidimicrobiia bacterium]|nr:deoxyribonuclease IV [Acidimicrobiia bacterium]